MATKLEKNVRKIIAHHGGTVVQRGVTGGNWSNCDGLVAGRLICDKYERNNLAMWIKTILMPNWLRVRSGHFTS